MDTSAQNKWLNCLNYIKEHLPEQAYHTWFEPMKYVSYADGKLMLGVPNRFLPDYVEEHYIELLGKALTAGFGPGTQLLYRLNTEAAPADEAAQRHGASSAPPAAPATSQRGGRNAQTASIVQPGLRPATLPPIDSQLNRRYNFDNFVKGESNKLSHTVGLAIAANPGKNSFNPFFLYGPSGVGKTHLVTAIGNKILEQFPEKRVLFVSAHLFKTQYTDSIIHNTSNDFINFYQTIDVLIIDDIQEITTSKTQLAFFHIFNHLRQNGRQIIITCDRPPVLFEGIEERMLTRFKWGMVAEMEKPDTKLRRDILLSKIQRDRLPFPADVVQYIAANVESSVRELEGIINSIMAYSIADNCEIDLLLTQRVVARAVNLEKKEATDDDLIQTVCRYYNIKMKDILSKSRKQNIAQARQVAMHLIHKYTGASYSQIGRRFGGRDHSTVLYACNQVVRRLSVEKDFRKELEEIEACIKK